MSNATVSSQVFVIRNAGSVGNADAGTMALFADGTDVYVKDASGNVTNLSSPSISSLAIALNDLTNVSLSSVVTGDHLVFDGSSWTNAQLSVAIDDLTDVVASSPSVGQVLQFDGSNWVPASVSGASPTSIDDLTDVDTTSAAPATGDALLWNNVSSNWEPGAVLQELSVTDGASTFSVLPGTNLSLQAGTGLSATYNTVAKRVTYAIDAELGDLNGTGIVSPVVGDILYHSGTVWENSNLYGLLAFDEASLSAANDGDIITWDAGTSSWVAGSAINLQADSITIGNDTGAGDNLVHIKANGMGTDTIVIGSGDFGNPGTTEHILIHADNSTGDIELEAGTVLIKTIPTAESGLDAGTLWSSLGTVKAAGQYSPTFIMSQDCSLFSAVAPAGINTPSVETLRGSHGLYTLYTNSSVGTLSTMDFFIQMPAGVINKNTKSFYSSAYDSLTLVLKETDLTSGDTVSIRFTGYVEGYATPTSLVASTVTSSDVSRTLVAVTGTAPNGTISVTLTSAELETLLPMSMSGLPDDAIFSWKLQIRINTYSISTSNSNLYVEELTILVQN